MGCDKHITCKTCKKSYYLGYGSYGTWLSVGEIDNPPLQKVDLSKDINFLKAYKEHKGHDIVVWSSDYTYPKNGSLLEAFTDEILVQDYDTLYQKLEA